MTTGESVLKEINFDGIIGPSHNYAGLSLGNIASATHRGQVSFPREAALQGLAKMRGNMARGLPQGFLLPLPRPNRDLMQALALDGSEDPALRAAPWSASSMSSAIAWLISSRNSSSLSGAVRPDPMTANLSGSRPAAARR